MKFKIFIFSILSYLFLNNCVQATEIPKDLVEEAEKVVLESLKSRDGGVRAHAVEVISTGQKMVFLPKIMELLKDNVVPVKFGAVIAIGDMQYTNAKSQLLSLLNDPDLNVKIATAYALCKLSETQYLSIIEKATQSDDQTVKANAAMLLGKLKNPKSLPVLYALKDNPASSDMVAYNATEAIARIGDEKIYPKIWTMLISVYADDRCMGIYAMGALGGQKGRDAILTMLDDEVPQVRLAAAEQLGALEDKSGQFIVLEYLTMPAPQDKRDAERCNILAAMAIGQIGGEKLTEFLPKLLKNNSPAVRLAAAKSVFILAEPN